MKLVIVLCLAAGALAYMPPWQLPQGQRNRIAVQYGEETEVSETNIPDMFKNLGLAIKDDPTANWKNYLKLLLMYGLDKQLYEDAQKVLEEVATFLANLDRMPEDKVVDTLNYDVTVFPKEMIAYFMKLEKAGVPADIRNELTRVAYEIMKFYKSLIGTRLGKR